MHIFFLICFYFLSTLRGEVLYTKEEIPQPSVENLTTHELDSETEWLFEGLDPHSKSRGDIDDPLEPLNRAIFHFNRIFVDGLVVRPLAALYDITMHDNIKKGVGNFASNAYTPVQTVNHILQGDGERAFRSVFRFLINTTIGIFGIFDPATEMGLENTPTTFNHTLTRWGVERGPFLMLPFMGPSCFRGAIGTGTDLFIDPVRYYVNNRHRHDNRHRQQRYLYWALYGVWIIHERAKLLQKVDEIYQSSDPYVEVRAYYAQKQSQVEEDVQKRKEGRIN